VSLRTWTRLAVALGGLFSASTAYADDESELEGLLTENVVSGASRTEELARAAPATTSAITAADIKRYGIRSLDEAIDFLGMGLVTQNPLHSVEVGGRGVLLTADYGNHVLLVVDGHVFNEPWTGTAYFEQGAGIPIELIDHIELVLGPGSVLYGGNAMLGVVNVVTKRASGYRGVHLIAEGSASPEQGRGGAFTSFAPGDLGGTYRLAAGLGHEFTLFGKSAELTTQVELYGQNGPSFAWGPQSAVNEDGSPKNFGPKAPLGVWGGRTYQQYTTSVPAAYARLAVGDLTLTARAASYTRRTPYLNLLTGLPSDFDEPRTFERDRFLSIDAQYRFRASSKLSGFVRAYGDGYEYLMNSHVSQGSDCLTPAAGGCTDMQNGFSRWAGAELQTTYDWTGQQRLTTMVGVDGRVREVGSVSTTTADTGELVGVLGSRRVTEVAAAAYLQQNWRPIDILHLNAGARFDSDPRGGDRLSPRLAAAVDPWHGGVLKLIYSEAFRAPSFYEAFFETKDLHPSPDIKSEVVKSVEATLEQRAGQHRFLMGLFRSWWSGMISIEQLEDGTYQYRNNANVDNYGYNARAEGAFGDLRYGLSVTGAHSRRVSDTDSLELPVAPQLFGNARLSYDLPHAWPTVAVAATFVGKRPSDRVFDPTFASPAYAPAASQIRLTLSERVPGIDGLSYRLGATFVTASRSAYVAGPLQVAPADTPVRRDAELAPINRLSVFGTLQYDFSP
jgi:outer membrane receptor for ferrienterochelin and colicins